MLALPGVCLGWIRAREGRVGANARASKLDLDPQSSAMTLYTTQGTRCRARAGARTLRTAENNAALDQSWPKQLLRALCVHTRAARPACIAQLLHRLRSANGAGRLARDFWQ